MGRSAEPPDPAARSLAEFAVGLRALRLAAGRLSFEELGRRAGQPPADLAAAVTGRIVPSFEITLAFVRACSGDEDRWARRWHLLQERLGEEAERAAAARLPAPPDPWAQDGGGQGAAAEDGWLDATPAEEWLAMASSLPSGEPLSPDEPLILGERVPPGQMLPPDDMLPAGLLRGDRDRLAGPGADPAVASGMAPDAAPAPSGAQSVAESQVAPVAEAPVARNGSHPVAEPQAIAGGVAGRGVEGPDRVDAPDRPGGPGEPGPPSPAPGRAGPGRAGPGGAGPGRAGPGGRAAAGERTAGRWSRPWRATRAGARRGGRPRPLLVGGLAIVAVAVLALAYLVFFRPGQSAPTVRSQQAASPNSPSVTSSPVTPSATPASVRPSATAAPGAARFPAVAGVGCGTRTGTKAAPGVRGAGDGWVSVHGGLPACGGQALATRKTGTLGLAQDTFTWTFHTGHPATCTAQIFIANANPSSGFAQYDVYGDSLAAGASIGQFEINQGVAKGQWVREGTWKVQEVLRIQLTDAPAYPGDTFHVTASAAQADCS